MDTETIDVINELNTEINEYKESIAKLKYDLGNNLSDESIYAINNQISWYENAINFNIETIKEIN